MANSTYRATVNRVLQHAGQDTIDSDATFDDNSLLTKVQLQAKLFVDRANRRLARMNRKRLSKRTYTESLASGDNDYDLDTETCFENLIQDSWFITTSGKAHGPLRYITHEQWLEWYPEGESTEGIPQYWFDYPSDGTGDRFGFSPPPNDTMTVQYGGYKDVVVLSNATDTIEFKPAFEDILWDHAQYYLEMSLGEGKQMDIGAVLDGLFAELRQMSLGPRDEPPKASLGIKLRGVRRCTGKYDTVS